MNMKVLKKIQMVDIVSQYENIKREIDVAITNTLYDGKFINGPDVKKFALELAEYLNVKHVIPCANGTDALQAALMALDLQPGDEIITVPFTFISTAEVIELLRLKPVFVDVDPQTFTIDVNQVEKAITKKTKCIIPVHIYGQTSHMEPLMKIAHKHNITVIEDNAQALGADYYFSDGTKKKAGTIGTIGCTSFFPSKILGCFGDGGALFTDNDELANKIQMIVNHGSKVKYYNEVVGINSRLDTLQAAILRIKLEHLDVYIETRNIAANYYDKALASVKKFSIPHRVTYSNHVFHQYTLTIKDNREPLEEHLNKKGIPTMVYYPVPLHLQGVFKNHGFKEGSYPVSEHLSKHVLSLPMHTEMDNEQLEFISESILEFYKS